MATNKYSTRTGTQVGTYSKNKIQKDPDERYLDLQKDKKYIDIEDETMYVDVLAFYDQGVSSSNDMKYWIVVKDQGKDLYYSLESFNSANRNKKVQYKALKKEYKFQYIIIEY